MHSRELGFGPANVTLRAALPQYFFNHNIHIAHAMPRVLLVKTSSLGDVVHNLPVATDIALALPGVEIDWVVEEPFAAIPGLHPGVANAIPAAVRRWRGSAWSSATRQEVKAFIARLRATRYDAVIDSQGLLKSAVITRLAHGRRYGLDWAASREPLFAFYDRTFHVPRTLHAVERNRSLAARALGYALSPRIDYGIDATRKRYAWQGAGDYAVLVHSTSARAKLWRDEHWVTLGCSLAQQGVSSVLPWGTEEERGRADRLAAAMPHAVVPPRMALADIASLLAGARCAIGVDTGLTHLAGALGIPTVGVYTATDPARTGLHGCARAANVGGPHRSPRAEDVLEALRGLLP